MEYIYICPKCGSTYGGADDKGHVCSDCNINIRYSGYTDEEWYALPTPEKFRLKEEFKKGRVRADFIQEAEERRLLRLKKLELEKQNQAFEKQKQEFANSFHEYYEYDVVTIVNENHGQINRENMMRILSEHAQQGWRLHSIYSNEIGKNSESSFGYGVNSTVCEDVLIFERRIEKLPD